MTLSLAKRCFGTLVLLVASATAALALNIEEGEFQGRPVVILSGPFEYQDEIAFKRTVLSLDNPVVMFDSPGGNLVAGIEIGKAIRLLNLETIVVDGAVCASACGLAWLGGVNRYLTEGAQVGFHAAFIVDDAGEAREVGSGNALVGAYVSQLGLSNSAILYVTSQGPSEMEWVSPDEAERFGLGRFLRTAGPAPGQNPAVAKPSAPIASPRAPQTWRVRAAVSQGYQNVRSGPGTNYPIVFRIPAQVGGITMRRCQRPDPGGGRYDWCEIGFQGQIGWLSSNGIEQER
ncbi:MAG: hypothetical protein AAGI92_00805 [Pseudomonadota bacterium]